MIKNITRSSLIADRTEVADSFFSRAKGLIGRTSLDKGSALVITRCNSIHMFFMRFPIDAIFLTRGGMVCGLEKNIKPWQLSRIYFRSDRVIELPAGSITASQTEIGDKVLLT